MTAHNAEKLIDFFSIRTTTKKKFAGKGTQLKFESNKLLSIEILRIILANKIKTTSFIHVQKDGIIWETTILFSELKLTPLQFLETATFYQEFNYWYSKP